jgi:ribosomal protein L11 methyltransferase
MYWLEVSVVTDGEGAEAVAEVLRPFAYQNGVVLEQLGDENSLDPDALEPEVTVKIYLPEDEDTPEVRRRLEEVVYHLGRLYPIPGPIFRQLKEEDWANAWKENYHPFRVGQRVWIRPSWLDEQDEAQNDDVVLRLDPGMAFGTGLHPTTQMCLQALELLVRPGMAVLDVGTGSGILAILAAKLGADQVVAVDTDELAVKTAVANASQNLVADQITVQRGTLITVQQQNWDVVVVNILAPVIIAMIEQDGLLNYVGEKGHLILSGIIDEQVEGVVTAVHQAGGHIRQTFTIRDWVALVVSRA